VLKQHIATGWPRLTVYFVFRFFYVNLKHGILSSCRCPWTTRILHPIICTFLYSTPLLHIVTKKFLLYAQLIDILIINYRLWIVTLGSRNLWDCLDFTHNSCRKMNSVTILHIMLGYGLSGAMPPFPSLTILALWLHTLTNLPLLGCRKVFQVACFQPVSHSSIMAERFTQTDLVCFIYLST
jgi:hypothetical protein